ncbi:MAG: hypothetical protein K6E54_00975 [Bacteroidaceae bacterium]|nr:hypothetical protein [Bacteroidaceae bacterium]
MEYNKYKGTMYERFDSELTDRMFAADHLIKKLEFLNDNIDDEHLTSNMSFLRQLEHDLVSKCVTPHFKLTLQDEKNASDMLLSILFQVRRIYNEIYKSWLESRTGSTPTLEICVNNLSERIYEKEDFRKVLSNMKYNKVIV